MEILCFEIWRNDGQLKFGKFQLYFLLYEKTSNNQWIKRTKIKGSYKLSSIKFLQFCSKFAQFAKFKNKQVAKISSL